ncbi:hypothetical protein BH10ACI1_BH10ACI1_10310 [soil metagenome]
MNKLDYKFIGRQRLYLALLSFTLLTGISFLINYKTQAEAESNSLPTAYHNNSLKSFKPQGETSPTVSVGERASVWLKLEQGKSLDTTFYGSDEAISALRSNLAEPTAQFSADINADGYADLISGFRNAAGGGLIALHRASRQAFEPTDEQVLADLKRGTFPATFEKDALILNVPTAPDFIVAGRFSRDSDIDLVFASRGGSSIYIMSSDGRGGFNAPQEIAVAGEITALVSEKIDFSQVYGGIVIGINNGKSSNILVFNGKNELSKTTPRSIAVGGSVDSIILARSDSADPTIDLFGLADGRIFTVYGIGNAKGGVNPVDLPFRAVDFAVGEFVRDRRSKAEIAVLSENGTVSYLKHGSLDTRPITNAEMVEFFRREGRGNSSFIKPEADNAAESWTSAEEHQLGVYALGGNSPARILRKAYLTGNETEDLLVVDSQAKRVQILFKEPNTDENRTSFTGETKFQNIDLAETPSAILPMRLNVMGQQGFVVFNQGNLEPTPVMAVPNATFTVTTTTDENNGACSAAGTGCSVREAVIAANTAAGADMITFTPNGTHQLTIAGANENAAATGDLDVLQALTIVGNGTTNTIITAGTTTANGIDKIFSVNPAFNAAFASSFSGMTMRFGRNPSTFGTDGYGGGLDWDGVANGTISMSNVNVDQNTATDGRGGGLVFTTGASGTGATLTNVNVTSNTASRTIPTNGTLGGGIFVGFGTPYSHSTGSISNNQTTGMNNNGGGLGIFAIAAASGNSNLSSVTISGNTTQDRGGGIYTERGLTFTAPTIISNNSTGINGGGLSMNVFMSSVNISKATMIGNSATTSGGAIDVGAQTGANGNILNMSFSRLVGNTGGGFTGLLSRGGTANVESNWWGCNTGPSAAPCDTAGTVGGVVDFDPWLQLRLTASPNTTPVVGESRSLTASFLLNSAGGAVAASNLDVLIGLPVTWSASGGTVSLFDSLLDATIQPSGTATANFTSTTAGGGKSATAQVDNGPATVNFVVGMAATTTTIISDNPDPSVRGQTVVVTFTVTVNAPGMGTPTGNVTVSDGVNACVGTVAAGSCNVALTTVGARTLTATYATDGNFAGSVSAGVPHQVNKANTTTTITSQSANPTNQGQLFTVFYTVAAAAPGTGTPTGTVTVSDGVNSCMGTVAAGQCSLALNTAGMRTLTATYGSDASFNGSVSPGVSHTVLPIVAASVEIGGRVMTMSGIGISNARVTLVDQTGNSRLARTSAFGYFRFADVQVGETYIISVISKRYQFAPQVLSVTDELTDLNFIALE